MDKALPSPDFPRTTQPTPLPVLFLFHLSNSQASCRTYWPAHECTKRPAVGDMLLTAQGKERKEVRAMYLATLCTVSSKISQFKRYCWKWQQRLVGIMDEMLLQYIQGMSRSPSGIGPANLSFPFHVLQHADNHQQHKLCVIGDNSRVIVGACITTQQESPQPGSGLPQLIPQLAPETTKQHI